jgi:hypothetical protein
LTNKPTIPTSVTINGTSVTLGSSGTVTAAAGTLTGDTLASNVLASSLTSVGTLTSLTSSGNISVTGSGKFSGDGSLLTNLTVNQASNIVGTQSNVTLVAGSYSYLFANNGAVTLPAAGGDEGAEIDFTKALNSSLSGTAVVVDQYVDRMRFFENGGTSRGAYIDLSIAAPGVGTLLNNRASAFVNAGVDVTLGNLKARIPTSGNRSLQISTVSGTYSVYGTNLWYAGSTPGGSFIDGASPLSVTTTPTYLRGGNNFNAAGYMDTWNIMDPSAGLAWRITCIIGMSYNNNLITIERLI